MMQAIRTFSWLFWASVLVGFVGLLVEWPVLFAQTTDGMTEQGIVQADAEGLARIVLLAASFIILVLAGLLWFMAARSRLEVIKWLLGLIAAVSLVMGIADLVQASSPDLGNFMSLASTVLLAVAVWFLFRADTHEPTDADTDGEI